MVSVDLGARDRLLADQAEQPQLFQTVVKLAFRYIAVGFATELGQDEGAIDSGARLARAPEDDPEQSVLRASDGIATREKRLQEVGRQIRPRLRWRKVIQDSLEARPRSGGSAASGPRSYVVLP